MRFLLFRKGPEHCHERQRQAHYSGAGEHARPAPLSFGFEAFGGFVAGFLFGFLLPANGFETRFFGFSDGFRFLNRRDEGIVRNLVTHAAYGVQLGANEKGIG